MSLAQTLLDQYKTEIQTLELVPSSGGCFEVSRDGKKIYSKLATGQFPEVSEIISKL